LKDHCSTIELRPETTGRQDSNLQHLVCIRPI
jgi:hypothetical protein